MQVSRNLSTFYRYSRVVLLTLLFSACTSQEVVSYRIRPTTTTVHTENLNRSSGFQFKVYAGPIISDRWMPLTMAYSLAGAGMPAGKVIRTARASKSFEKV